MKRLLLISWLLILLVAPKLFAQSQGRADELKALDQRIKLLEQEQTNIERGLKEIKELLLAKSAVAARPAQPKMIDLGTGPFRGNKDALVILLDFSDYQCPFCGRFVRETMPLIDQDYLQSGKIKYVFRDLPLESIHPLAFKAAEAARCAGEQGRFWEMHDRLYQNQNALDVGSLPFHAQALGLNVNEFAQCLNSDKYSSSIRKDISDATNAGIQGTPNFVIALVDHKDSRAPTIKVWQQIVGAQPYGNFKAALDRAIAASRQPM